MPNSSTVSKNEEYVAQYFPCSMINQSIHLYLRNSYHRMNIEIVAWTTENFETLPTFRLFPFSCKNCVFWESLTFNEMLPPHVAQQRKRDWLGRITRKFGNCGFIAFTNNEPIGFAQYAPSVYFPALKKYTQVQLHDDDIFLSCLYIPKTELRGSGIGTQILQKVIQDLHNRGYTSLNVLTKTDSISSDNLSDWLVRPLEFFLKNGFTIVQQGKSSLLLQKHL